MNQSVPLSRILWQLADSSFPSGGFAHSGGLEALFQWGELTHSGQLLDYLVTVIRQCGHYSLPQFIAAHQLEQSAEQLDQHCHALLSNHVSRRASLCQGQALLSTCARVFHNSEIDQLREQVRTKQLHGHYIPTFGRITRWLNIPLSDAVRLFLHITIRDLISSAVRLNIIGPLAGQAIWPQLDNEIEQVLNQNEQQRFEDISQTSPLLDILQANHDRLYSRLFQS
ncbi:MAG: urease accessory UreF family protein [Planctomycetota bacterium]|nr:urease accessory UreF family protein [Planctomycetota bacterium]